MKKSITAITILLLFLTFLIGCEHLNKKTIYLDLDHHSTLETPGNNTIIDWPVYNTADALEAAASNIYEGTVSNISFAVLDEGTKLRLNTIYEVQVSKFYKGDQKAVMHICVMGGIKGYRDEEQNAIAKEAGLPEVEVVAGSVRLNIGETYLFFTKDYDKKYNTIINMNQFALSQESSNYSKMVPYLELKTK